jgi:hypothetical protein
MNDKKNLIDDYFNRHKDEWKIKIHRELKTVTVIQKFFNHTTLSKNDRLDDTPTDEKAPRKPF